MPKTLDDIITIPLYKEDEYSPDCRLYYDGTRLEFERRNQNSPAGWSHLNTNPDALFDRIDDSADSLCNLAIILNRIPSEYHEIAAKSDDLKITMLVGLHRAPKLYDIARDAPVLAYMLTYAKVAYTPSSELKKLVGLPRRKISEIVGGHGTQSEVKFITKIKFGKISRKQLHKVNLLISNPMVLENLKYVSLEHVDEILLDSLYSNWSLLSCSYYRRHIEKRYGKHVKERMDEVLWSSYENNMVSVTGDIHQVLKEFYRNHEDEYIRTMRKCPTYASLNRFYYALLNNKAGHRIDMPFGPPPIPGTDNIIPIRTVDELFNEGFEMDHCAALYCREIKDGNFYIYKICKPERATIGISIDEDRKYSIADIRLYNNKDPSDATVRIVEAWLKTTSRI